MDHREIDSRRREKEMCESDTERQRECIREKGDWSFYWGMGEG